MTEFPLWVSLAVKIVFAATIVVAATAAAEKSGPLIAGLIIAMPVSVGPTYVMLGLTASPQFIAASALGSIAANAAVAVFVSIYVLLARRVAMPVGLALSLGGWFATAALEQHLKPAPLSLLAIATMALLAATLLTRHAQSGRALLTGGKRWFDLPLRALFVGLFAGAVVTASEAIGPAWTGLFAAFPVALTTSIVLMHPRVGVAATSAVLATAIQGIVIYPLAFILMYYTSVPWGVWWAMAVALGFIVAWAWLVYVLRRSRGALRF